MASKGWSLLFEREAASLQAVDSVPVLRNSQFNAGSRATVATLSKSLGVGTGSTAGLIKRAWMVTV